MASRFIALTGPGAAAREKAHEGLFRRSGLIAAVRSPNHGIWVSTQSDVVPLENGRGAILGPLFRGYAPPIRVEKLAADEARDIERTSGRFLIENYWGGYVAFLLNGGDLEIVRDPSGAMPCYDMLIDKAGTRVVFSDVETLQAAGFDTAGIDWEGLRRLLIAYDLRTERTALSDVKEVLAGTQVTFQGLRRDTESYWLPAAFARPSRHASAASLAENLSEIVTGVVSGWASVFKRPLLGVSGGLDSSIVAAVLAKASPHFDMVTFATDEGDGDERKYARALGEHLNVGVEERFHRLDQTDVTRSLSAHLPRPLLLAFGQSELAQKLELADRSGADCFFSGVGGDNVFCNIHSASPFLDRLMREGLGRNTGRTLDDIGTLTGASHIEILLSAARRVFAGRPRPWFTNTLFLSGSACETAAHIGRHPWLEMLRGIAPGKQAHIAMLARIQGTIDGYSRANVPGLVNPLLSQPLVEFCLSVPTWEWIDGGRNRSLARQAFSDRLPRLLLDRTSKGTPNSFAFEVVDRNRKRLRDHLVGGCMAAQGLLDLAAIGSTLQDGRPMKGFDHMRLSWLAEAESWARLHC